MNFDVVVRHDTTMWNEGFELAREPYATVTVASEGDAQTVVGWVDATYGLMNLPWGDDDKAFTAQAHPSAAQDTTPLSVTESQAALTARIAEWRGL